MDVNLVIQYVIKNYKNYISNNEDQKKDCCLNGQHFSFSEKRIKMKKDQDPIERLAFHLITYRGVAVNVANNGLASEELTFPIDKYLGEHMR